MIPLSEIDTVPALLTKRARTTPGNPALYYLEDGQWSFLTWSQYEAKVSVIAAGLRKIIQRQEVLIIDAPNSLEWELYEKAALKAGIVIVGVDYHAPLERKADIIDRVEAVAILTNRPDAKLLSECPTVRTIITIGEDGAITTRLKNYTTVDLEEIGASAGPLEPVRKEERATIIFTSGSTGDPKGIPYTHQQYLVVAKALLDERLPAFLKKPEKSIHLCWLPLSNLFQRVFDTLAMAWGGASYIIGDPSTIMQYPCKLNPSVFIGVPRFFEKIYEAFEKQLSQSYAWKVYLTQLALKKRRELMHYDRHNLKAPLGKRFLTGILDYCLIRRWRSMFVGNNIEFMLTGSAPTPVSLLEFFNGMGIELYEAYGCSESIIPVAMNRPTQNKHGSVGRPLPYHEVVISDSGEVLVKGPGVFEGYLDGKDADDKVTPEGFLSTGDVGYIDKDGYLFLTGRKTDMIKTSTGRRIFPQKIESLLKKHALVEHAILVGNGRKHLAAIVTVSDMSASEVEIENLNRIIQESNGELADYERLKAILVVQSGFSVERGHITLNQKVRRGFIEQCYKQQLDNLYGRVSNSNRCNDMPLIEVV